MEKSRILEDLFDGEVKFKFTKADGTIREMRATLSNQLTPEKTASDQVPRVYPENQIRVYDLDVEGWRSFKMENLIEWNGEPLGQ